MAHLESKTISSFSENNYSESQLLTSTLNNGCQRFKDNCYNLLFTLYCTCTFSSDANLKLLHLCLPWGMIFTIYNAALLGNYFTWNWLEWHLRETWRNRHSWHRHHMHHRYSTRDSCCYCRGLGLTLSLDLFLFWFIICDSQITKLTTHF